MSRLEAINQFDQLPLFGQALCAVRMVQRAAPAVVPAKDPELSLTTRACAAAVDCCAGTATVYQHRDQIQHAMQQAFVNDNLVERHCLRQALRQALDAVNGADACQERPFEVSVNRAAKSTIALLGEDKHLSRMQITMLLAADVDQLLFACGEVLQLPSQSIAAKYAPLGKHVMGRLAPVHPLTRFQPAPNPQDLAR